MTKRRSAIETRLEAANAPFRAPRRRCVLLFTRAPRTEGRLKGLHNGARIIDYAVARVERAARLSGADLVIASPDITGWPCTTRIIAQPRILTFDDHVRRAFARVAADGYTEIVAVPGDVPGLRARHLAAAFAAVRAGRIALGPTSNGGIYALGVSGLFSRLIEDIRWRDGNVFEELERRAHNAVVLPRLHDVNHQQAIYDLANNSHDDVELRSAVWALIARLPAVCIPIHADTGTTRVRRILRSYSSFARPPPAHPRAPHFELG